MHYEVKFHTHTQKQKQKNPDFAEASSPIPHFSYGLCSIIPVEAVSKIWDKPKQKFGQVLVNCFQIILLI